MRIILFLTILFVSVVTTTYSQARLSPNNTLKGKKQGFWSELVPCDTVDINGDYHVIFNSDNSNEVAFDEGIYKDNKKQGFWKQYWTKRILKKGIASVARDTLKSITEYCDNFKKGIFLEYHRNGDIKWIGTFGLYSVNKTYIIQLIDWKTDPSGTTTKTDTIHIHTESKKIGTWHYFEENGKQLN